jgi:hypothetical protein
MYYTPEQPEDWRKVANVNEATITTQMPYLSRFGDSVEVNRLSDGRIVLVGSNQYKKEQVIYRYNSQTQTAELIADDTRIQRGGESAKQLIDSKDFNHYMEPEQAFGILANLMGTPVEQVRTMFPKATNYNQILLSRAVDSLKIGISFNLPDQPESISCVYDYHLNTGELEHVYSNDGHGKVWAKWNQKK